MGMARSTVHLQEGRVLRAIIKALGHTVAFPQNNDELQAEARRWAREDPYFFGVITAGDGTLIDFLPRGIDSITFSFSCLHHIL